VVQAILTHLGRWRPEALERAPPVPASGWPEHANLPLTYHPVPDFACLLAVRAGKMRHNAHCATVESPEKSS